MFCGNEWEAMEEVWRMQSPGFPNVEKSKESLTVDNRSPVR